MIVFRKATDDRQHHSYSHIECDVDGCSAASPTYEELGKRNLMERGWYISAGQHRCPEHFNEDTPPQGPIERAADGSEGFVR
jgi:hypothetical protein